MGLFLFVAAGILTGMLVSWRRAGKVSLAGAAFVRGLWLPVAGFLLDGLFSWFPAFALRFAAPITCASYLCILAFLYLNRAERLPALLMAAGSLSNFLVIACNGFRMPVSPRVLAMFPGLTAEAVYAEKARYFVAQDGAVLYVLGDVIPVPVRALGAMISVGDLLLGVGLLLFIVRVLTQTAPRRRGAADGREKAAL